MKVHFSEILALLELKVTEAIRSDQFVQLLETQVKNVKSPDINKFNNKKENEEEKRDSDVC